MSQGAGNVPVWQDKSVLGDNLGNHIATKTLDMSGYAIVRASGVYLGSANNLAITTNTTVFGGAGAGIYVSTHVQIAGALQIGSTATILGNEFSVGGSTFIISAGRVGIATNTPTGLFQVGGGSLTILANGNVGIGVTNPGARLDIQQSDTTQSYSLRVGTITTAYHLVVTTTGRVGIGTLTPTSKLNIESIGPTGIDINSNTDNAYINIKSATGKISFIDFYDGNQKKLNLALDSYNFSSSKFVISSLSSVDIAIAAGNGSGGKVGIGTFSPQAKLDIYGDGETILLPRKTTYGDPSGINGMIYYNQNIGKFRCYQNNSWIDCIGGASSSITQGDSSVNIIDSGVGYINFIQDGNEVMRISNSKLAIGTITPIDNQNVKLHVSGSIHLNQNSLVGDFNTISGIIPFNTNSQIERFSIFLKGYEVMSISTSGLVGISTTNPSSALHIVSTGIVNSALRVDLPSNIAGLYVSTTGLIGVGTLNPKTKLHIENNEENFIALVSPQNSLNGIAFYSDSINNLVGGIYRSINNDLRIWIANSDIFTVTNTGNVGIGNTSPSEKLHVNGNLRFSGALMPNGQAGNSGQVLVSQGAGNAPIWQDKSVLGDNLGNHIATRTLSMGNYPIINVSSISINGSGINLGSTAFEVIGDTFTVRSGGRVGIGGIDSTSRLSILNANYILGWGGGYQISSLLASDQGGAIELGGLNDRANPITNGTPYIDFHFGTGSGEDYNYRIINNANNRLSFISKTATTLVLSTTNVGIGASSPSPWDGGNRRTLHIEDTTNQALIRIKGSQVDMETGIGGASNDMGFLWTRTNHPLTLGTNNSERIRITNDGRIGIGTDSPHSSARIDIKGLGNSDTTYGFGVRNSNDTYTFWVRDDGAIATSGQRTYLSGFDGSGNHWIGILGGNEPSNLFMTLVNTGGDTTADAVHIAPRGNSGIYVNSSGNVGVGTSNPGSYKLYVNGNAYFTGSIDLSLGYQSSGNYVVYYNGRLYYYYSSWCPIFYSFDGERYKPEGGIIHGQAGKFFDRLHTKVLNFMPKSGRIKAKIKVEEPETSYIDYISIVIEDKYPNGEVKKYELKPKWASKDLDKLTYMDSSYSVNIYGDEIEVDFGEIDEAEQSVERIVKVISKGYYDPFYNELQKEEWREIRKSIAKELIDLDSEGNLNIFRPVIIRNIDEFGYNSPQNLFTVNGPVWFKGSDKTIGMKINGDGKVGINLLDPDYELKVNGDVWINFNQWTLSDERLIKEVEPIKNAVEKIKKIEGVRYKFKDDLEKNLPKSVQLGVIAQNLEKVFPELVVSDTKGFKAISYEKLVPVLIEAIKDQQFEIDKLKRELELIKGLNQSESKKHK